MAKISREEPAVITALRGKPDWSCSIEVLGSELGCSEKEARSAIDRARLDGYNIKNTGLRLFQLQPVKGPQTKPPP